jgi:hypothetical protein
MNTVITERGWPAHYICADDCRFRRNTLLENGDTRVVISTVGNMVNEQVFGSEEPQEIELDTYYETKVFHAKYEDPYWEADVLNEVPFDSDWCVSECSWESDAEANTMHDKIVYEILGKMNRREITNEELINKELIEEELIAIVKKTKNA